MGFLIKCPICGKDFSDGKAYTGTSGVAFSNPHHLYEYCDAGLHLDCLEKWEFREEFSKGYFNSHLENFKSMNTLLYEGDGWILGCGPAPLDKEPYYAEVDMIDWPCRLYSNWNEWDAFVNGEYKKDLEGKALEKSILVMSEVKLIAPNLKALSELRIKTIKGLTSHSARTR